jgi:type I restriction enzyme S subunit
MTLEIFFEKFDQFADAPNAVANMRELVLELAIQGRLVVQNSNDEPAFKQLERIAAKKSKTGRVVRMKACRAGSSAPEETDTHVPDGWEKASLAELVTVLNGRAYSKDELLAAGMPVLRVGNLFTSKHWYYSDLQLELDKYCDKGDLIFAWSASFGPFIWPGPKVIYHYHIWKLELHSEADLHKGFLYWFLQNKTREIKRAGHGVSMLHMTKEKMEKLEVMVPPLAEQKRIVAKVDELMALCDRLETQQQERETRHAALARASLARFADAPTPANLHFLFHKSYTIPPADLRKSILTLAVQGKLVPQDSNDEPAEKCLSRLGLKSTNGTLNGADLEGYSLPSTWARIRFEDVAVVSGGVTLGRKLADRRTLTLPYLRVANVKRGKIDLTVIKDVSIAEDEIERYALRENDLLMTEGGDWDKVGRAAIWRAEIPVCLHQNHVFRARMRSAELAPLWFDRYFNSPIGRAYFESASKQTTNLASINMRQVRSCPIPLPPLAEQRRIVAKVEQLMALVDELETQLAASSRTAAHLLEAVVHELTQRNGSAVHDGAQIQAKG